MNIEELSDKLVCAGVHPGLYSIALPASESESYSLGRDGSTWSVLYKERGIFTEIGSELSQAQGCLLLHQLLSEAMGLSDPTRNGSS